MFTSVEIFIPYHFRSVASPLAIMLLLMATKFGVVTAFFMHLRFDSQLFRRVFFAGVFLAVFVYLIVMFDVPSLRPRLGHAAAGRATADRPVHALT